MIEVILVLLTACLACVFVYTKVQFNYWKRKGVPTLGPLTPAGDVLKAFIGVRNQHVLIKDCYEAFRAKGHKFGGIYFTLGPVFFPIDVDLIKRILQTDFEYFSDRGMYHNKKEQPLSEHIFSLEGETWKNRRQKLIPAFSSGKLKMMFPTVMAYSEKLVGVIRSKSLEAINADDLFRRYTMDVVLNCFFGVEESNITKGHTIYMDMAHKISNASIVDLLKVAFTAGTRNPGNLIKIVFMDPAIYTFFKDLITKIISYRQKNNVRRADFLDYLLSVRKTDKDNTSGNTTGQILDIDDVLAEVLAFFTGGFETSSFTLSCCMYELSRHQDVQERLRKEVNTVCSNTPEPNFQMLTEMKYMDQIILETVRMHTVISSLNRYCVKDYVVPGTDIVIEKGTPIMISAMGYHYDPEYFPEPETFNPDRFANDKTAPYMIGFGGGPRYCLGRRFAELQMKIILMQLVRNFRFTVNEKTGPELEIDNVTRHVLLQHKNTLWLNCESI